MSAGVGNWNPAGIDNDGLDLSQLGDERVNHKDQMAILYELYDPSLPRLGPGDDHSTRRALDTLLEASPRPMDELRAGALQILDIGCGNGSQTIQLARQLAGTIVAVDNHQPYLDELTRRAEANDVSDRVRTLLCDMANMQLAEHTVDLIWSEGALYNMGFGEGLAACRSLLTRDGLLAVSELCWLRPDPPAECRQFFANEYPAMVDVERNLAMVRESGFDIVGHFVLPESAWTAYYQPVSERIVPMRTKYGDVPAALDLLDAAQTEIEVYDNYSAYYGYVFFLMIRDHSSDK